MNSIKEEKILENEIGQTAYLVSEYNSNSKENDKVFHYRLYGPNATSWSLSYEDVQIIYANRDLSVYPVKDKEKYKGQGYFQIGGKSNWLYSLSFFPREEAFKQKLIDLLGHSLRGEN